MQHNLAFDSKPIFNEQIFCLCLCKIPVNQCTCLSNFKKNVCMA